MNDNLINDVGLNIEPRLLQTESRPSNTEILRDYEITIKFINRGCIVQVGCKTIAFESVENAMSAVNAYVTNPYEEQQKWRELLK